KNYDDEICFEVLAKLVEIGLINDEEYAKKFAKKLVEGKHFGSWRAKQELRMKGIDDETIEEVLEPYEDDTAERLAELVEKKYARYIVDRKGLKRVQGALARQGYGYADIRTALED
ncbi:MAG: regulatory protein RecX, partial [Oscillospiraceae bacterium]